jgi:hypothetical protein
MQAFFYEEANDAKNVMGMQDRQDLTGFLALFATPRFKDTDIPSPLSF